MVQQQARDGAGAEGVPRRDPASRWVVVSVADEKIKVEIESDYEDHDAKKAIKDAEKIEDLAPKLEIEADTSKVDKVTAAIKEMATTIDTESRGPRRRPWTP